MDIKEVVGELDYSVWVTCPECKSSLNLTNYDYLVDYQLSGSIFGTDLHGWKWENLDIEFNCQYCKKPFMLTKIEY